MNKPTLYLPIGFPASGKSTYFSTLPHLTVISTDELRRELFGDAGVQYTDAFLQEHGYDPSSMEEKEKIWTGRKLIWAMLDEHVLKLLKDGRDVAYDGTNLSESFRIQRINRFKPYAIIHGLYFNVPLHICKQRNQMRDRVVTDDAYITLQADFVVPSLSEGFDILDEINEANQIVKREEQPRTTE